MKQFAVITFLVLCLFTAKAQDDSRLSVGGKAGLNMNQFAMPGTTFGANVGAYARYNILPFLDGKIEVLYSQEGGKRQDYSRNLNDPILGDISGNLQSLNYINPYVYLHNLQVPLLVELTLPEFREESIIPKLILGGSYSYTFGATEYHTTQYIFKDGTFSDIPYLKENVGSNYKTNQLSVIAGLGMQYNFKKRDFTFDIRYRQGLTQLNNVKSSFSTIDGRLYSTSVSFNFSMTLFKF